MTNSLFERAPNDPKRSALNPLVKLTLELGPLIIFFFANTRFGIFTATAAFMLAITLALGLSWLLTRRLAIMPLVSGIVVLVFGGLTIYLQDELFIKLKPTIVNALFGVILLGGLLFGKALLGYVLDSAFKLTAKGWRLLTLRWGLFFFFLALLNEFIWRNFSTDFWVSFKVYGMMPITLVFAFLQAPLLSRHSLPEAEKQGHTGGKRL